LFIFWRRSIENTLDTGWRMLAELPRDELLRIKEDIIEKYMNAAVKSA
jgi:V/A-type H+-transporting ATPase subunit B